MHTRKLNTFLCCSLSIAFVPAAKSGDTDWNSGKSISAKNAVYETIDPTPDPGFNFSIADSYAYTRAEFNNDIQTYSAGAIIPLLSNRNHVLMADARFSWNEPLEEQYNVGLIHRWRLNKDWVIGESIYWDRGNSRNGNTFDRFGLGFEVLGDSTELHVNYYLPEDQKPFVDEKKVVRTRTGEYRYSGRSGNTRKFTRQTFRQETVFKSREASMEGLDIELDQKIPFLPEWFNLWASVGYYDFKNPFGADLNGFKGGAEWRLNEYVSLSAKYYDERHFILGDHWFAGVEASIPLDGSGVQGMMSKLLTPKANQGLNNDRKILSSADREYRPRLSESGLYEHSTKTSVSTDTKKRTYRYRSRNAAQPAVRLDHDGFPIP